MRILTLVIALTIACFAVPTMQSNPHPSPYKITKLTPKQIKVAKRIRHPLLCGMGMVEAGLDPKAVSRDGGVGTFQATHGVDRKEKRKLLSSIEYQIQRAVKDLSYWEQRFPGDKVKVLMSYNGGTKWKHNRKTYKITHAYAMKVITAEQHFRKLQREGQI